MDFFTAFIVVVLVIIGLFFAAGLLAVFITLLPFILVIGAITLAIVYPITIPVLIFIFLIFWLIGKSS